MKVNLLTLIKKVARTNERRLIIFGRFIDKIIWYSFV